MLDEFEVRDLPESSATVVDETTPLRFVADAVRRGAFEVVVVSGAVKEQPRGMVLGDVILKLASRMPDSPVGLLPSRGLVRVCASTNLQDAMRCLTTSDVGGLAVEQNGGWSVVTREQLFSLKSWQPLIDKRERRISGLRPAPAP